MRGDVVGKERAFRRINDLARRLFSQSRAIRETEKGREGKLEATNGKTNSHFTRTVRQTRRGEEESRSRVCVGQERSDGKISRRVGGSHSRGASCRSGRRRRRADVTRRSFESARDGGSKFSERFEIAVRGGADGRTEVSRDVRTREEDFTAKFRVREGKGAVVENGQGKKKKTDAEEQTERGTSSGPI